MVFTLRVPSAIAQGPTWARVVSILGNATTPPTQTPTGETAHVTVGIHEAAAH